eukprot:3938823-Rhodomonas_salina.2
MDTRTQGREWEARIQVDDVVGDAARVVDVEVLEVFLPPQLAFRLPRDAADTTHTQTHKHKPPYHFERTTPVPNSVGSNMDINWKIRDLRGQKDLLQSSI